MLLEEPFLPPDAKSSDLSNGVAKTDIRQHLIRYKHAFIEEEKEKWQKEVVFREE